MERLNQAGERMSEELSLEALRVYEMLSDVWCSRLEVQIGNRFGPLKTGNALRELLDAGLVEQKRHRWGSQSGSGRMSHSYRRTSVQATQEAA